MNKAPANKIIDGDIRAYIEDGVVCLRQMFDRELIDRMRDASLRYMAAVAARHDRSWAIGCRHA
jgi:hypothetical protein